VGTTITELSCDASAVVNRPQGGFLPCQCGSRTSECLRANPLRGIRALERMSRTHSGGSLGRAAPPHHLHAWQRQWKVGSNRGRSSWALPRDIPTRGLRIVCVPQCKLHSVHAQRRRQRRTRRPARSRPNALQREIAKTAPSVQLIAARVRNQRSNKAGPPSLGEPPASSAAPGAESGPASVERRHRITFMPGSRKGRWARITAETK
jgi:hypothetical protein